MQPGFVRIVLEKMYVRDFDLFVFLSFLLSCHVNDRECILYGISVRQINYSSVVLLFCFGIVWTIISMLVFAL